MIPSRIPTRRLLPAAIVALLWTGSAWAGQLQYTLRTGLEHSDNINLSDTDPISQNILIPGVDFNYVEQGSTLQANISGSLEYRDYLGNAFDNQTLAALAGTANWTMIPQRLDFVFQDAAAVEPLSTLSVNTPNNQQQTNALTLGPTLHFRLGQTLRGDADLRYINSRASKTTEFNSSRGLAALHIIKDLDPLSQFSMNVQGQHVHFDTNSTQSDYDRTDVYARYQDKLKYFNLDIMAGGSRINFNQGPSSSSPLARLTVDWLVSSANTLSLSASEQYSDAAQDLQTQAITVNDELPQAPDLNGPRINVGQTAITSQPYRARRVDATYGYHSTTLSLTVSPFYEKLKYPNIDTLNQNGHGMTLGIDYKLNPRLTISAYGNAELRKYSVLDRKDKYFNTGIALIDRTTSHWSWRLSFDHRHHTSNTLGQTFTENEIYFGVAYTR